MSAHVTANTVYSKYWEPRVTVAMYINPQLIHAARLLTFHGWEGAFLTSITSVLRIFEFCLCIYHRNSTVMTRRNNSSHLARTVSVQ